MSAHDCKTLTKGCYRCDLNVDEMRHHLRDMKAEVIGIRAAIEVLTDHEQELRKDVTDTERQIDSWDMGLTR